MSSPLDDPAMMFVDITLAGAAIALAYASLRAPLSDETDPGIGQRRRIILFMAFGILLALIWARLAAPDVAIAEAAIGAGFAGALLLTALRDRKPAVSRPVPMTINILVSGLSISLAGLMAAAIWIWLETGATEFDPSAQLGATVAPLIADTGVSNPVTAVLLNFRAYDTLLELAVLLAAAIAIAALGQSRPAPERAGEVLRGMVHWLVPALLVVAGYLLWIGAKAPGGAFQAGALLASAGVILHLSGGNRGGLPSPKAQAWLSVSGIAVFLFVGIGTFIASGSFLNYRGDEAAALILIIETFATLSIGVLLIQAYLGGLARGNDWDKRRLAHPATAQGEHS